MYPLAALFFRDLYYAVAIKVGRSVAEIDGIRRAQGMLRFGIGVGIESGGSNAVLGRCPADSAFTQLSVCHVAADGDGPHSAISPRFAMRTEVSGLMAAELVELWRTALAAKSWRERRVDFRTARMVTDRCSGKQRSRGAEESRSESGLHEVCLHFEGSRAAEYKGKVPRLMLGEPRPAVGLGVRRSGRAEGGGQRAERRGQTWGSASRD